MSTGEGHVEFSMADGGAGAGSGVSNRKGSLSINAPLLDSEVPAGGARRSMAEVVATEKNKLGTFLGVYLPCILGIFGAILFLRLPWAIGEAGIIGGLLIFAVAGTAIIFTVTSIAAISTNGTMKGGGAYYMISRALGPEFGGAVGLVFFAANSVGITFYLIAFAEEIQSLVGGDSSWAVVGYASASLFVLVCVSLVGAAAFSWLNFIVSIFLLASIILSTASFIAGVSEFPGYTGMSLETLKENFSFGFTGQYDFFKVFIICFPAMTGVMSGANMSGDLRDPGKSIGSGTMYAVITALVIYSCLVLIIGSSVKREVLQTDLNIMQNVCFSKYIVAVGLVSSTISSALNSLVGSARVLQALARDNLFPFLKIFKWGSKKGDEPRVAVMAAWLIAQACLFVGNLNAVASLISGFFLLVYFFTNLACGVLKISGAPNFRPRFRYFTWHTAFLGALMCLIILFLSGPVYASVSIVVLMLVWLYVHYTAPITDWGDVTQALIYHQVRKYLLRLDERKSHPKFWRPSILLCVQHPATEESRNLIALGNNVKKGGMYVLGNLLVVPSQSIASIGSVLRELRHLWLDFIDESGIKAFNETTVGPNARICCQNLVLSAGVGGMKPNTVIIPMFKEEAIAAPGTPASVASNGSGPYGSTASAALASAAGTPTAAGAGTGAGSRKSTDKRVRALRSADSIARITSRHMPDRGASMRGDNADYKLSEDDDPEALPEDLARQAAVPFANAAEFCSVLKDVLFLERNLIVAQGFDNVDKEGIKAFANRPRRSKNQSGPNKYTVDIWVTFDTATDATSTVPLQLQLAHILHRTSDWHNYTTLRLVGVVERVADVDTRRMQLEEAILQFRIDIDIWVLPIYGGQYLPKAVEMRENGSAGNVLSNVKIINELIRHNSAHTCLTFLTLPALPDTEESTVSDAAAQEYVAKVKELTLGLPPSLLVSSGRKSAFVTSEL